MTFPIEASGRLYRNGPCERSKLIRGVRDIDGGRSGATGRIFVRDGPDARGNRMGGIDASGARGGKTASALRQRSDLG